MFTHVQTPANHPLPLSSLFMPVKGEEASVPRCLSNLWGHLSHALDPISISLKSKAWYSERKWCTNITHITPSSLLTNSVSGMNKCACVHAYTCASVCISGNHVPEHHCSHCCEPTEEMGKSVGDRTEHGRTLDGRINPRLLEETEYSKEVRNEPVKYHNPLDLRGASDSKPCESHPPRTAVTTETQLWQGPVC